jgi:hypothetical protein
MSGILDADWRINVACRDSKVYAIKVRVRPVTGKICEGDDVSELESLIIASSLT